MEERERYSNGLEVRRAVLGDAHVDRALTRGNAFNQEFQELITRYAWGEIWTRPTSSGCTSAQHSTTVSPVTRSRKCCCNRRSTAACRQPTTPSIWPRKF